MVGHFFSKIKDIVSRETELQNPSSSIVNAIDSLIKFKDDAGIEVQVDREIFREKILPQRLRSHWHDANLLSQDVLLALDHGLEISVLEASHHNYKIDHSPERGVSLYARVLVKLGQLTEAEEVLKTFLSRNGEQGLVLLNLAKVLFERDQIQEAESTLWRSLVADPNQETGLLWYAALGLDRGQEAGYERHLQEVSELRGSWKAQLWLAKMQLVKPDFAGSLVWIQQAFKSAPQINQEGLFSILQFLNENGYIREITELCEPVYIPTVHGFDIGELLIRARLILSEPLAAQSLYNKISLEFKDLYRNQLRTLQADIYKVYVDRGAKEGHDKLSFIASEPIIWSQKDSPFSHLAPFKDMEMPQITFSMLSGRLAHSESSLRQLGMNISLSIAEAFQIHSQCRAHVLLPLSSVHQITMASESTEVNTLFSLAKGSQWLVTFHSDSVQFPIQVHIRIYDAKLGIVQAQWNELIASESIVSDFELMTKKIHSAIQSLDSRKVLHWNPMQRLKDPAQSDYLTRLHSQVFSIYLAGWKIVEISALEAAETMVMLLKLSEVEPQSIRIRLLTLSVFEILNRVHSQVASDYRAAVLDLYGRYPFSGAEQVLMDQFLKKIL